MQTMMIGQRPCTVELCPDPEYLLIQPVDEHDAGLLPAGLDHILEWNPGNHFVDSERRTARAFLWCMQSGAVCSSPSP